MIVSITEFCEHDCNERRNSIPLIRPAFHPKYLVSLFVLVLVLAGACAPGVAKPHGWASGVIHDGKLYKGTTDGRLVAIDIAKDGKPIARYELDEGKENKRAVYGNPVYSDGFSYEDGDEEYTGLIFVSGYDGYLYGIDPTPDGDELSLVWNREVGDSEAGSTLVGGPAAGNGIVVVGSSDGYVYAYDVENEDELWRYKTGNKIWSTPTIHGDVVYIGSLDKNLYALRLTGSDREVDERLLWSYQTNGAITAKPLVVGNRVFFGSFDNNFYALNTTSGTLVWKFEGAKNWYWTGAVFHRDTIFVPSMDKKLYALDINTGVEKWTLETEGAFTGSPGILSNWIAIGSDDQNLYFANLDDGEDVEKCRIGERLRSDLVTDGDTVYVSTWDHAVVAVRMKENGRPDSLWRHVTNKGDDWKEKWRDSKGKDLC